MGNHLPESTIGIGDVVGKFTWYLAVHHDNEKHLIEFFFPGHILLLLMQVTSYTVTVYIPAFSTLTPDFSSLYKWN